MIVVADTSVILNLCRVQHEHLIQQLFRRVLIPAEVAGEFTRLAQIQKRFSALVLPEWIEVLTTPKSWPAEILEARLDIGESAAIALCSNQKADVLLMDEKAGREVAHKLGIRTVGVAGILIDAKNEKLIPSVTVLLNRLESEANFWVSSNLRHQVLQLAGE